MDPFQGQGLEELRLFERRIRVATAGNYAALRPILIDGMHPAGPSGEDTSGRLLVCDSRGFFREIVVSADDVSAWFNQLL